MANGPSKPEVMVPIIIDPCMPTSVRYWLAPNTCTLGCSSSVRISIAFSPATKKNSPIPTMYCLATTLWSVDSVKYRKTPSSSDSCSASDGGMPEQPLERIVGKAQADEEADDAEEVAEEDRDVVLARVGVVGEAGAGDRDRR